MSFKKIDEEGILPGPRVVFVSGYDEQSCRTLDLFLKNTGLSNLKVIPCREDMVDQTVSTVLKNQSVAPLFPPEKLPGVMLWAGISHKELDLILNEFKKSKLKRPIFATTTENNLDFSIKELMRHLLADQKAMGKS